MKISVVTLQQALDRIPIGTKQNIVNLFGIVSSYEATKKELSLYDQSRDIFRVEINTNDSKIERIVCEKTIDNADKFKRLVIRVGDIVYIQRLVISSEFTFKSKHIKDITIFDTFSEKFVSQSLQKNFQFTEEHLNVIKDLQNYHSSKIFNSAPQKRSHKEDFLYDLVFEVIHIERRSDRAIFVGWNGNPLKSFKSDNLVSFENLWYGISLHSIKCNTYDYDFLKNIYNQTLLFNVTIFDPFLELSDSVRIFDYVFMPKILISEAKNSPGKFCFRYNSALRPSRTIRICEPNSPIGRELSSRIEQYFLIDDKPLDLEESSETMPCCLSPIPRSDPEYTNDSEKEFVSQISYFPTSTPIKSPSSSLKKTRSMRHSKQRSVVHRSNKIFLNPIEYFTESSQNDADSLLNNSLINERLVRVIFELIRGNYPFDLDRYPSLKTLKVFPINENKGTFLINAMYGGFIKYGFSKTDITFKEFDIDMFKKQILLIRCLDSSCNFTQTVYEYFDYDKESITDCSIESLHENFSCKRCGWPKHRFTITISFKIKDRNNNWQIVHLFDDIAERLFGLTSIHFRTDLTKVYNNIRSILFYLDYYSIHNQHCHTFIEWILRPLILHDFERIPRLQVIDFKAKSTVSLGHRL